MAKQTQYWQSLIEPGVVALVGAGGKTTVLSKLVEYGRLKGQSMCVTTTTKLYENQVVQWKPFYGEDINAADFYMTREVKAGRCAAWFSGREGTKVLALATSKVDGLAQLHPDWQILVEADGAKEKWLKAPRKTEPVIPAMTKTTIGLVNLHMLEAPLNGMYVHNLEEVLGLLNRPEGALVTPELLAQLVVHPRGLFQYSRGRKIVFCTGFDCAPTRMVDDFVARLGDSGIERVILADGYKVSCEIRRIISLR